MDTRRPRLLRQARDQLLDLLAGDHHQISQLVDDHNDIRHRLERLRCFRRERQRIRQLGAHLLSVTDTMIESGNIAHANRRHELVAPFHLADAPIKRVGCLLHIHDDRRQQVRNTFVDRQLEHLRVNQDQADFLRFGLVEQRKNHRVDTDRLARAGRSRHQQVRHLGEVDDHRLTTNILAERHGQRRTHVVIGCA